MLNFLEVNDGFIQLAKQAYKAELGQWIELPNGVTLRLLDQGVLQVRPSVKAKKAIVISCAIHGNETAPIEIVSQQISDITTGNLVPKNEILYVLGNPRSMEISQRFVALNLNRLFNGAHKNYQVSKESEYEISRAAALENYLDTFFNEYALLTKIHLDLHTAIKPSYHKTFAIRPYQTSSISESSRALLVAFGIEAVLQHNKPSTTFSSHSVERHQAEAYTLELGKVKAFGENDPQDFAAAIQSLDALVEGRELNALNPEKLINYKVVAEIIKKSDDFKFYVAENVENFTPFPQGTLIAEDFDYNYRVAFEEEAVVFPNIKVPVGQRVAVMVTKMNN